ncbi:MAG TPA: AI-2E family transporter [Amycolatopsis sp.]|nr:AI-2E family transporter [Amycolatopsis sp.]
MTAWRDFRDKLAALRERRRAWRAAQVPFPPRRKGRAGRGAGADDIPDLGTPEPIAQAEDLASRISTEDQPLGRPGRPMDRRSPFFIGLVGALGVGVAYGFFQLLVAARDVLTLIGLAAFLAIGLNPAVEWLVRRRLPRWAAVLSVLLAAAVVVGGFLAAAIPPLISQGTMFVEQLPRWWQELQNHSSLLGRLNDRFHLQARLTSLLSTDANGLLNGAIGAGRIVLGAVASLLTVVILTIYFLADLPRIRRTVYRLVPHSRRPRVILIGDEIFTRIGGFLLGNLITSLIAGIATFVWTEATGIPYPVLLSLLVAILDLIPVIGSTVGGLIVGLVALSISFPLALATGGYILAYRLAEDYLLFPKIIGKTVRVPAVTTVVAFVVGGALLGVVGAFVAIPVAAVIGLILNEVLYPRLDRA